MLGRLKDRVRPFDAYSTSSRKTEGSMRVNKSYRNPASWPMGDGDGSKGNVDAAKPRGLKVRVGW